MKVLSDLDGLIKDLELSILKFRISVNLAENARKKKFDELLFLSTLHGLPVSYRALSRIYNASGERQLKKALKRIGKIGKKLQRENYAYALMIRETLSSVKGIISSALEAMSIDEKIFLINNAIRLLAETRDKVSLMIPKK